MEMPRWYNRLADWPLVRWAVPRKMALANVEVMTLAHELELMLPLWKTVKVPVTIIQGDADRLVDPANADFAAQVLSGRVKIVRVPEAGHFILWKRPEIVRREIKAAVAALPCGEPDAPRTALPGSGSVDENRIRRRAQTSAAGTAAVIAAFGSRLGSKFP
jgi:hypothetical protein